MRLSPLALLVTLGATFLDAPASVAPSFAVVVHSSNATTNLKREELQKYFLGDRRRWPDGSRVVLVVRDSDSLAYRFMTGPFLNMSSSEYRRHLASLEYQGDAPVLKTLNSDCAACKFVFNVPGGISLVESGSLASPECAQVRVVRVDGKLPAEEGYRLR